MGFQAKTTLAISQQKVTKNTLSTFKSKKHLVIIDSGVEDYQTLANGVLQGVEVFILDSHRDGVEQITEILHSFSLTYSISLHIVSHGTPGTLYLGSGRLSLENLNFYTQQIQSWTVSELMLYSCNLALGDAGEEFIDKLHNLTGVNVAASRRIIGGGYWSLEFNPTETPAISPFHKASLLTWKGQLAPTINNLDNSFYTEQNSPITLDSDITFSGGANYGGGYLEFSLSNPTSSDFLSLSTDANPSTVNGEISIVGNIVYLGDGTNAVIIGNLDSTLNGQNGQNLRINFTAGFANSDFSIGSPGDTIITDWTTVNQQVKFGTDTIAGLATPTDTTIPPDAPNSDQNTPSSPGTMTTVLDSNQSSGSGNSVRLTSSNITTQQGFDIVRGPYIYSNTTVSLSVGEQLSFEWQAEGGGDAYDVYGYIIDVNNGHIETILDETGSSETASTAWATETITVSQAGEYRFVFVSGTYDLTGGKLAGAQLFIDNVTVTASPSVAVDDSHVSTIAQRVQYSDTSDAPETLKTLTVSVENTASETANANATISITPENDPPVLTSALDPSIPENTTTTTVTATDPDNDNNTFTYSITGGADVSLFNIDTNTGELSFDSPPDFENPGDNGGDNIYEVEVTISDNNSATSSHTLLVTVSNVNDNSPVITSSNTGIIEENNTTVTTITSTDIDGDTPTYSITGGADSSLFSIDTNTGELSFDSAPDFETPGDNGADNVYEVEVSASDGVNTTPQTLSVTVTDSNNDNAPVLTSAPNPSVAENTTTVTTVTASDVDGDIPTYSITGGADSSLFSIDTNTGELSFNGAPNFENPADNDGNNVYEVEVSASDSFYTTTQTLSV
ncbi:MAG: DUF4347 domain-containing protein, partial [Cyanobacteria bacterium P01_A01_bin.80]